MLLVRDRSSSGGVEIILPTATSESVVDVKVYLSGAVKVPGVYDIGEGARLSDAIQAAGGPTEDADLTAVNLAIRVKDQDHWHIPKAGEAVEARQGPEAARTSGSGKLNLNTASAEELMDLPGIGEVRAEAILRFREANGPLTSLEELLAVTGIGPTILEGIRDLVEIR